MQAEATVRQQQERLTEMLHQAGEHAKERAAWNDQRLTLATKTNEVEKLQAELEAARKSEMLITELKKEVNDTSKNKHSSKTIVQS